MGSPGRVSEASTESGTSPASEFVIASAMLLVKAACWFVPVKLVVLTKEEWADEEGVLGGGVEVVIGEEEAVSTSSG